MKQIAASQLVSMNSFQDNYLLRIELAYARSDNLLFGERIYRENAQLWLHESLSRVVLKAAESLKGKDLRLVLYDGLRTTDAQGLMLETQRVQDNPHWLEPPRLLSPPGAGAHPRGMAIDLSLETLDGALLDMGTAFDYLAEDARAEANLAHRAHPNLSEGVKRNRALLDNLIVVAAQDVGVEIDPLAQEWWDFRLPQAVYEDYAPLADADLPSEMQMCD